MNCWDILGIAPTGDIGAIKKAFAALSKLHHPEDDPEGFQRLRAAYRRAILLAENLEPPGEEQPVPEEPPDQIVPEPEETLDFQAFEQASAALPETLGPEPELLNVVSFEATINEINKKTAEEKPPSVWNPPLPAALFFGQIPPAPPRLPEPEPVTAYDFSAVERVPVPDEQPGPSAEFRALTARPPAAGRPTPAPANLGRAPRHPVLRFIYFLIGLLIFILLIIVTKYAGDTTKNAADDYKQYIFGSSSNLSQTTSAGIPGASSRAIPLPVVLTTSDKIDKLKKQAESVLAAEAADRQETLAAFESNTAYASCLSASRLHIDEAAYVKMMDDYKAERISSVSDTLEAYRHNEEALIRNQILPVVKQGLVDSRDFIITLQCGSMIGMTYEDCLQIAIEYMRDHNEAAMDEQLLTYNRLTPPDQWGIITPKS